MTPISVEKQTFLEMLNALKFAKSCIRNRKVFSSSDLGRPRDADAIRKIDAVIEKGNLMLTGKLFVEKVF